MRNFLVCILALLLSSCTNIKVDDFGEYWGKGYVDPALLGRLEIITPKFEEDRKEARSVKTVVPISQITEYKSAYQIDSLIKEEREKKDYSPSVGRSLKVGNYTFLMTGDSKDFIDGQLTNGTMYRYKYDAGIFSTYDLNAEEMSKFIKVRHPEEKKIDSNCYEKKPADLRYPKPIEHSGNNEKTEASCTRIKKFDQNVYRILTEIPDTPEFWGKPESLKSFSGMPEEPLLVIKH